MCGEKVAGGGGREMEELGGILNQAERYMQTEKGKCICTGIHVNTSI